MPALTRTTKDSSASRGEKVMRGIRNCACARRLAQRLQREDDRRRRADADRAGGDGDDRRLEDQLHEEIAMRRAERLAQADLAGALGHRDQHDVHHADGADRQGEHAAGGEEDRDGGQDRSDQLDGVGDVDERQRLLVGDARSSDARPRIARTRSIDWAPSSRVRGS